MGRAAGDASSRAAAIRDRAFAMGFDAVGIAPAGSLGEAGEHLRVFLQGGRHGGMEWTADKADRRADVRALWPEAASAILLGVNYGPPSNPLADLERTSHGVFAAYARGRDYHDVIKKRIKRLASWIADEHAAEVKVFVDTAPLMEKPLAEKAGLGWQGKHTNLVSRRFGSWLLLGAVLTDLDLEAGKPEPDSCGSCTSCLDICPTGAFPSPYQLDARRCISYLTIEHKGHIAREFREAMGNRVFSCDDCLAVCPWNKYAQTARDSALWPRAELTLPLLNDLAELDDESFREVFAGSPVKRTGRDRFVRNVLIAIGNAHDPLLAPVVRARLRCIAPGARHGGVGAGSHRPRRACKGTHKAPDGGARRSGARGVGRGVTLRAFVFGLGYTGLALASELLDAGWQVAGTCREDGKRVQLQEGGIDAVCFGRDTPLARAGEALKGATHVLSTIPPGEGGELVLDLHAGHVAAVSGLEWIGYISTTGVYGDRGGGWVDESSELRLSGERGRRRVQAEEGWLALGRSSDVPVHVFRAAGIYGPGRSILDALRAGSAHRVDKPGQVFSRIHVDDFVAVLRASMARPRAGAVYNVCDDEAAAPADVTAHAAGLLGIEPPPLVPFEQADLSAMARSFYADNKRVRNARIKQELGVSLRYPTYREGLAAILAEERAE